MGSQASRGSRRPGGGVGCPHQKGESSLFRGSAEALAGTHELQSGRKKKEERNARKKEKMQEKYKCIYACIRETRRGGDQGWHGGGCRGRARGDGRTGAWLPVVGGQWAAGRVHQESRGSGRPGVGSEGFTGRAVAVGRPGRGRVAPAGLDYASILRGEGKEKRE